MVTKADLKDQIGVPGPHPLLYCEDCGAELSANAGDYWQLPAEHEFICECGQPLRLMDKRTVYTPANQ